jgi:hypothetical protein
MSWSSLASSHLRIQAHVTLCERLMSPSSGGAVYFTVKDSRLHCGVTTRRAVSSPSIAQAVVTWLPLYRQFLSFSDICCSLYCEFMASQRGLYNARTKGKQWLCIRGQMTARYWHDGSGQGNWIRRLLSPVSMLLTNGFSSMNLRCLSLSLCCGTCAIVRWSNRKCRYSSEQLRALPSLSFILLFFLPLWAFSTMNTLKHAQFV